MLSLPLPRFGSFIDESVIRKCVELLIYGKEIVRELLLCNLQDNAFVFFLSLIFQRTMTRNGVFGKTPADQTTPPFP